MGNFQGCKWFKKVLKMKKKINYKETNQMYREIDFAPKLLKIDFYRIIKNCQNREISLSVATTL